MKKTYRPRKSIRPMLNAPIEGTPRKAERMAKNIEARLEGAHQANKMVWDYLRHSSKGRARAAKA
jgi:hypothetical protein